MDANSKYRGKTKDGKWLYSNGYLKHKDGTVIMIEKEENDKMYTSPVIPETVTMATGYQDKNGKDIYYDDVIWLNGLGVVVWFEDRIGIGSGKAGDFHAIDSIEGDELIRAEVNGNIHDNPNYWLMEDM